MISPFCPCPVPTLLSHEVEHDVSRHRPRRKLSGEGDLYGLGNPQPDLSFGRGDGGIGCTHPDHHRSKGAAGEGMRIRSDGDHPGHDMTFFGSHLVHDPVPADVINGEVKLFCEFSYLPMEVGRIHVGGNDKMVEDDQDFFLIKNPDCPKGPEMVEHPLSTHLRAVEQPDLGQNDLAGDNLCQPCGAGHNLLCNRHCPRHSKSSLYSEKSRAQSA